MIKHSCRNIRRGKQKNGDLDLIISKEAGSVGGLLDKLTTQLIQKNHLKHRLWHSSEVKKSKRQKVPGVRVSSKQIFDGFEKVNIAHSIVIAFVINPCEKVLLCVFTTVQRYTQAG